MKKLRALCDQDGRARARLNHIRDYYFNTNSPVPLSGCRLANSPSISSYHKFQILSPIVFSLCNS